MANFLSFILFNGLLSLFRFMKWVLYNVFNEKCEIYFEALVFELLLHRKVIEASRYELGEAESAVVSWEAGAEAFAAYLRCAERKLEDEDCRVRENEEEEKLKER